MTPRHAAATTATALRRALQEAAKGKRRSPAVARALLDPEPLIARLGASISSHAYAPSRARGFVIYEPKRRVISALPFRDRVVQHFLIDQTLPHLESWFAPQSYACRTNFGTHRALRRAIKLHRTHAWLLRLDIHRFFPSVNHALLLRMLIPRCPVEHRWLLRQILAEPGHVEAVTLEFPGDEALPPAARAHGLPIGNLTSQVWANAYLTPVDHLLASQLGIGTFVRYCDDIIIYSHDRAQLENAWKCVEMRCEQLRLRLHPTKCRLHRTTEPVAFLGFVLERRGNAVSVRLRQENVRRFRRRMRDVQRLVAHGALEPRDALEHLRAWLAHARHGTTKALVMRELERLGTLLE